jgi:hypothetical protein
MCRNNSSSKLLWEETISSDAASLWGLLNFLTKYRSFENATLSSKHKLETWNDVEAFDQQLNQKQWLSRFESSDIQMHPFSQDELLNLIDRFLAMVSAHIARDSMLKGPARKKWLSQRAREFAINEIYKHICRLDENKKTKFTSKIAYTHLQGRAKAFGRKPEFITALTMTLVEEACSEARKKLSEIGVEWKCPGGRPNKRMPKNLKKPSVQSLQN